MAFMRQGAGASGLDDLWSRSKTYGDDNGQGFRGRWRHGWYSTMIEYDGTHNGILRVRHTRRAIRVNIRCSPGERLVRNWSNVGVHVNMKDGGPPGCLTQKVSVAARCAIPRPMAIWPWAAWGTASTSIWSPWPAGVSSRGRPGRRESGQYRR